MQRQQGSQMTGERCHSAQAGEKFEQWSRMQASEQPMCCAQDCREGGCGAPGAVVLEEQQQVLAGDREGVRAGERAEVVRDGRQLRLAVRGQHRQLVEAVAACGSTAWLDTSPSAAQRRMHR